MAIINCNDWFWTTWLPIIATHGHHVIIITTILLPIIQRRACGAQVGMTSHKAALQAAEANNVAGGRSGAVVAGVAMLSGG